MTKAQAIITYASIVSTETDKIAMIIAILNNHKVKAGHILNAYIQAPVTEKVLMNLGSEFGKDARMTAVVVRALYGLRSTRAAFRSHLTKLMESLQYQSPRFMA